ncbi:MAG: hypothetical protein ABI488_11200 [Polyangiaceae bacterium]
MGQNTITFLQTWSSLGGVVVGWFLNRLSSRGQKGLEDRLRIHSEKVEAYAIWINDSYTDFYRHIASSPQAKPISEERRLAGALAVRRIALLEEDPEILRLVKTLWDLVPEDSSPDHTELYYEINAGPGFSYPPFDDRVDLIIAKVKASRPKK